MSIMVGVGRGAQVGRADQERRGAGAHGKVDTLVVDKTGTLTEGKPRKSAISTRRPAKARSAGSKEKPSRSATAPF
jgi:cation transport ATPase